MGTRTKVRYMVLYIFVLSLRRTCVFSFFRRLDLCTNNYCCTHTCLPCLSFCFSCSWQCWGRNNKGQLGLGDTIDRGDDALLLGANLTAVILGDTDIPTAIDLGIEYTCVLLQDGAVKVGPKPAC